MISTLSSLGLIISPRLYQSLNQRNRNIDTQSKLLICVQQGHVHKSNIPLSALPVSLGLDHTGVVYEATQIRANVVAPLYIICGHEIFDHLDIDCAGCCGVSLPAKVRRPGEVVRQVLPGVDNGFEVKCCAECIGLVAPFCILFCNSEDFVVDVWPGFVASFLGGLFDGKVRSAFCDTDVQGDVGLVVGYEIRD